MNKLFNANTSIPMRFFYRNWDDSSGRKKKKESTALPGSPKEVSMYVIKLP